MEDLHGVPEGHVDRIELRRTAILPARGRLDEEVEQNGLLAGARDEHMPAGAQPREQRLGSERHQHRADGRIDRVAPGAQHLRAGLRGQGMPGGDDAVFPGSGGLAHTMVFEMVG